MSGNGSVPTDGNGDVDEPALRLLLVKPDTNTRTELEKYVEERRNDVDFQSCGDPTTALELLAETAVDCVVAEYDLPEMDGIELYRRSADVDEPAAFVLFTEVSPDGMAREAFEAGVDDFVGKRPDEAGTGSSRTRYRASSIGNSTVPTTTRGGGRTFRRSRRWSPTANRSGPRE